MSDRSRYALLLLLAGCYARDGFGEPCEDGTPCPEPYICAPIAENSADFCTLTCESDDECPSLCGSLVGHCNPETGTCHRLECE